MQLATDVTISGSVLLNQSQILDESVINLLITCGIKSIDVVEDSAAAPEAATTDVASTQTSSVNLQMQGPEVTNHFSVESPVHHTPLSPLPSPAVPSAENTVPPVLAIRITPDAMSATLVIEPPPAGTASEINSDMILAALAEEEVVFGIDIPAIDRLIESWSRLKRRYEVSNIAVGTQAQPAREGAFAMNIRHLRSKAECEEVEARHIFWEIAKKYPHLDRVFKGKPFAEKQTGHIAPPGKNIHGAPVFSDEVMQTELTLEKNVSLSTDGLQLIADVDGIAYMIEDTVGVIPIDFDGSCECTVTPDGMSAEITVYPPGPGGSIPEKSRLKQLLAEKGVNYGILESEIEALYGMCQHGAYPADPVTVARGTPPENGKDGQIIYHFNTTTSLAPSISDKGQADYKSVNIVNSVTEGQQLASIRPPENGVDGTDVTGKSILAKPGTPVRMPQGPKTRVAPENPDVLLAATDGIVRLSGSLVEVCEGFVVPGNVDFSTGNINYNKTVIVNGDVKAGFTIHCGADLQVNGTIEDCQVTVGGNVLCRFGFLGQGKGIIDAKGDVNLGFLKNQTVKSFKNITIAKEAINCTLLSRGTIEVHGSPLSVAGGELKARTSIIVHTAGNHTGIKTLLEAGTDFLIAEELEMLGKQENEVAMQIKSISEAYGRFRKSIDSSRRPTAAQQKKNIDFTTALRQAQQQLAVLEERKTIVAEKLHKLDNAFIRIEHGAYPGTLLKFGERHFLIKEELTGPKSFHYIGHEIKIM